MEVIFIHCRELFDLSGKTAVVTGGYKGLGKEMAVGLAEMGANVVICARNLEQCVRAAEEINKIGVETLAVRCDVSDEGEVKELVDAALKKFKRIDILVNNAGISKPGPLHKISLKSWNEALSVNVTGTFLCCKAIGRVMIEQRHGKIINIASIGGVRGFPPKLLESISYCTSKGAIVNLTRDLAGQWAQFGINVNAINPGWFPTELSQWVIDNSEKGTLERIPLGRFGREDELKGAVVFLASEASRYVTGHILMVDGGYCVW